MPDTPARPELPELPRKDVRDAEGDLVGRSDESILKWGLEVRRKALEEVREIIDSAWSFFKKERELQRLLDRKEPTT